MSLDVLRQHGRSRQPVFLTLTAAVGVVLVTSAVHLLPGLADDRTTALILGAVALAVAGALSTRFAVVAVVLAALFSALVRRLIPAPDASSDPAAIAPFIVMLPLAVRALTRRQVPVPALLGLVLFGVSALHDVLRGVPSFVALAVPILAGLALRSDRSLSTLFVRSWLWTAPIAFVYGIVQLFDTPPWDVTWVANAGLSSIGQPGEATFRPFATFPAAGAAAMIAVATLLMAICTIGSVPVPVPLRVLNIIIAITFIASASVRSAWLWGAAALLVALMSGASRKANLLVLPVIVGGVVVVSQIPAIAAKFADRAGTLSNLGSDGSFEARSSLLARAGSLVSLFGGGLGTGQNASGSAGAVDNGYLIVLAEGGIVGVLALALVLWGVMARVQRQFLAFPVFWILADVTGYNWDNIVGLLVVAMTITTASRSPGRPAEGPPPAESEPQPPVGAGSPQHRALAPVREIPRNRSGVGA